MFCRIGSLARLRSYNVFLQKSATNIAKYAPSTAILQMARSYAQDFGGNRRDFDDMDDIDNFDTRDSRSRFQPKSDGFRRANVFGGERKDFNRRGNSGRDFGGRFQGGRSDFGRFGQSQGSPRSQQQQSVPRIDWSEHELTEFKRDFYQPSEKTINRSSEEIAHYRKENNIIVPLKAPKPLLGFDELVGLPDDILGAIQKAKFQACTSIQAQGMPIALSGQNMVGIAQTG